MGIYGCWSISGDVKGLWLRAGVKTWTLLSQRPSQEYARLISITANSAPRSSVSLFFALCPSVSLCLLLPRSCAYVWTQIHQGLPIPALDIFLRFRSPVKQSQQRSMTRFSSCFHDNLKYLESFSFSLLFDISEYLFPPPLYPPRFWARCHGDASRRLLGPVTSLPGRAGGRVHRKEQAGDSDLPLHPGHADLLQVQRRVGSPRWPLDWTDCWPSNRYTRRKICEPHR